MNTPLVTVLITTYNQQNYIGNAIDSVLAQQTDFPYEIFISDDASTDSTPAILRVYAQRFPCIRLRLREKNVGISRNWFEGLKDAQGQYVCTLEGDDWWTDDNKLTKQLSLLKEHPNWSAVSHRIMQIDNNGNTYGAEPHDNRILGHFASSDLFLKGVTFSCTACLCRNIFCDASPEMETYITANRSIADFALCMLLMDAGEVYVMDETLSAYRVAGTVNQHTNYNASTSAARKYADFIEVIRASDHYWQGKYHFTGCILSNTFFPFWDAIKEHRAWEYARRALSHMPFGCKIIFPFYFIGRSLALAFARICRTIGAKGMS